MAEDQTRLLLNVLLRTAGRLSAIADEIDGLRGQRLSADQRARRDRLVREQDQIRATFQQIETRLRTISDLRDSANAG